MATPAEHREYKPLPQVQVTGSVHVDNMPTDYARDATVQEVRTAVEGLKGAAAPKTLEDLYNRLGESLPRTVTGSVQVTNFPTDYPLPNLQFNQLKSLVRLMAWDPAGNTYKEVIGFEGEKTFAYDANGNLTEVRMVVVLPSGDEVTVRRTLAYDSNGNLTRVSRWELVS